MKRLLIALIRFYQAAISPRTPPSCRFTPTCSSYAIQALERFGFWKGSYPVPEKKPKSLRGRKR